MSTDRRQSSMPILLRRDPFLLMPEFLSDLPMPAARLVPDDGVLTTRDDGKTWVLLVAQLNGNVYSGAFQDRFIATLNAAEGRLNAQMPHLQVLRVGAIFYAQAGAKSATTETTRIGVVSLVGTVILILIVFRAIEAGVADLARNRSRGSVWLRCMRLDIRRYSRSCSVVRG